MIMIIIIIITTMIIMIIMITIMSFVGSRGRLAAEACCHWSSCTCVSDRGAAGLLDASVAAVFYLFLYLFIHLFIYFLSVSDSSGRRI